MIHHICPRLLAHLEMAVIRAADRNAVVARRRLDPHILESGFARDPSVGDAVERDAARHAQVLGAGGFAQPDGTLQEHFLGVVLDLPGEVLPMPHGGALFPVGLGIDQVGLVELDAPLGNFKLAVLHAQKWFHRAGAAVGRQAHHLAALVPVGKQVTRGPAVERAETRHVVELVAQESAYRLEPDLLEALEFRAFEPVIALRFARQGVDVFRQLAGLGDVRAVVADPIHHHDDAFLERRGREGAVGMRQMMRQGHDIVGARQIERILGGLSALDRVHHLGHVGGDHAGLQLIDRQDVTVAHHEVDVVERDAFRRQAVIDDALVEAGGMFLPRDPLLADRERDLAIAKKARADIVVIRIDAEDVGVLLGHRNSCCGTAFSTGPVARAESRAEPIDRVPGGQYTCPFSQYKVRRR